MKKVTVLLLSVLLILGMTACGNQTESNPTPGNSSTSETNSEQSKTEDNSSQTEGNDLPVNQAGEFNLTDGTVILNNGIEMPILGIGTYRLSDEQAENSVYWALRDGYRLIDTARIYGNEAGVGRGIKRAINEGFVTREEVFVTTKMWTDDYRNGESAINASLERLGLDYIDLKLLPIIAYKLRIVIKGTVQFAI